MRRGVGAWMGLALACGPAVPVDTSATGSAADTAGDDDLPPLTSGGTLPATTSDDGKAGENSTWPRLDVGGQFPTGPPIDDPCELGWDVMPLPPAVVMVIDVSGSMVTNLVDHDTEPKTPPTTRWYALGVALSTALLDWDPTHDLGLRTFPSALATTPPDPFACDSDGTAIVPVSGGASAVLDALPPPEDLGLEGASPLRAAIYEARALLSVVDPGQQQFLLLITDGAPNCAPEDIPPESFDALDIHVQDAVYLAFLEGISTAVIAFDVPDAPHPGGDGEPITNPLVALDILAGAGGLGLTARVADDVPGLQAQLFALRATMASRRLRIPDPSYGNYDLDIGGEIYGFTTDCDRDDGYVFLEGSGNYDIMHLCGSAAAALQRVGQATIRPHCIFAE